MSDPRNPRLIGQTAASAEAIALSQSYPSQTFLGTVTAADLKGLRALAEATGRRFLRGIVLYTGSETVPFARNLLAMPASALWRPGATAAGSG